MALETGGLSAVPTQDKEEVTRLKKLKGRLSNDLHALVRDFETETGLSVMGIEIQRASVEGIGYSPGASVLHAVNVVVEI